MKIYIVGTGGVGGFFGGFLAKVEKFSKEKNIDVPINEMIYGAIKLLSI